MSKTRVASPDDPSPKGLAAFKELFWKAREAHIRKGATEDGPAHKEAIAFAKKHQWPWAIELVDSSLSGTRSNTEIALAQSQSLENLFLISFQ